MKNNATKNVWYLFTSCKKKCNKEETILRDFLFKICEVTEVSFGLEIENSDTQSTKKTNNLKIIDKISSAK